MKQKFYTTALIALIALSTCIFTGCENSKGSNDNKNSSTFSKKLSSWPNDLPKFKGGKVFQVINDEKTGVMKAATFGKIKNPTSAHKNYKTALSAKGWVLDDDSSDDYAYSNFYAKGTKRVHVRIHKDGATAQIMYLNR